ncbi:hypothetical protein DE146DRAFT_679784 [Phaeosphaeria sp. MPI-PUGE-AT-0046c]|nr:hypothetical protein DE146DRAFT_679784 [Phaeosphaeria sp. MPI-PUGE-AT-0046c]
MNEVADWLQLQASDDFWIPRDNHSRKLPPTANQILPQMKNSATHLQHRSIRENAFGSLILSITIQLLASCYTTLPASGACNLPIFPQRRQPQCITALRLHSQHRTEPAAGYHARASSETGSRPGTYEGQSLEEQLTQKVSQERGQNNNKQSAPRSMRHVWTNSTSLPRKKRTRAGSYLAVDSDSSSDVGFFSRLILQRIPSVFRLRRTQSAPRSLKEDTKQVRPSYGAKHHSSNPSIGSPVSYPYEIPQIRRTSATLGELHAERNLDSSVRMCGRGDLITTKEYVEEREANIGLHLDEYSCHALTLPTQMPEIASSATVALSNATTVTTSYQKRLVDYLAFMHRATQVHKNKDLETGSADDMKEVCDDAGPNIDECPVLQKMFAKTGAPGVDDSSDSDIEVRRKRRSILGGVDDMEHCIVEQFKPREDNDSLEEER